MNIGYLNRTRQFRECEIKKMGQTIKGMTHFQI